MHPRSVRATQADALFVSALQRSDELNAGQIWRAVELALDAHGGAGCAGRVAQEFGDHPESAAVRMRWARAVAAILAGQSVTRLHPPRPVLKIDGRAARHPEPFAKEENR